MPAPFDDEIWSKPVIGGDVAAIAMSTSLCISLIAKCLADLNNGTKISVERIERLEKEASYLEKQFDILSGYKAGVTK